jgi:hypothetical protein
MHIYRLSFINYRHIFALFNKFRCLYGEGVSLHCASREAVQDLGQFVAELYRARSFSSEARSGRVKITT